MNPDPAPYDEAAGKILDFVRKAGLVKSVDLGVWLYAGNAGSQLAAFLQHEVPLVPAPRPVSLAPEES